MAKFKCKVSGEFVVFEQEHDVVAMRSHPSYEEVIEDQPIVEESSNTTVKRNRRTSVSIGE